MSPSLSRFQLLPYDIIGEIIEYFPPSSYPKGDRKAKVAIMHSCQSWRMTYMQKYISSLLVVYKEKDEVDFSFKNVDMSIDPLLYPIDRLVRTLTITIPLWTSVMSGDIVQWMQTSPAFSTINFLSVMALTIRVPYNPNSVSGEGRCTRSERDYVDAFFRHVISLTPNANDIKLFLLGYQRWPSPNGGIGSAERSIADLVCGRKFTFCDGETVHCFPITNPRLFSRLTSFCFDTTRVDPTRDTAGWAVEVARRNSETLESVALSFFDLESILDFLFSGGSPIVYTSLVKLNIAFDDGIQDTLGTADLVRNGRGGVHVEHFPALIDLKFTGPYRETIGLFFGPENRSLECLDATSFVEYFDEENIFPVAILTRFYGLKTIRFGTLDSYEVALDNVLQYRMMCTRILKSFAGSSSAVYYISTEFQDSDVTLELLDDTNIWSTLQQVHTPRTFFTLGGVLDLLTKAPLLQSLVCMLSDELPLLGGVNLMEHPEYLKAHYYPLGNMLSRFVAAFNYDHEPECIYDFSLSALLLAGLCPRLRRVGINECIEVEPKGDTTRIDLDRSVSLDDQAKLLSSHLLNTPQHLSLWSIINSGSRGIVFF